MGTLKANRKPNFFWQALLIVLPVIVLAVFGFLSLRQDKLLAVQEAQERAQVIDDELRTQLWTAATNGGMMGGPPAPFRFQVDNAGQLIFPPPLGPLPKPAPFRFSELNQDQARLWQQARIAEAEVMKSKEATKAYYDFLSLDPPKDFAASACYALGLLLAKEGNLGASAEMFRRCTKEYPDANGETGLPLSSLAQFKLLELETNRTIAEQREALDSFCSNLVHQPMPLTDHLLDMIPAHESVPGTQQIADKWRTIWQEHENERRLYAAACSHFGRGLLPFRSVDEMVFVPGYPTKRARSFRPSSSIVSLTEPTSSGESNAPSPRFLWFTTGELWPSDLTNTFRMSTNSTARPPLVDQEWLAVRSESSSTSWWYVCKTVSEVGHGLTRVLDRGKQVPDYFGIGFTLNGRTFARDAFALQLWSEHHYGGKGGGWDREYSGGVASDADLFGAAVLEEAGKELLRVNVYLTSPATLFSRQRARTFWFSSLIATAVGAVLVGLVTAWRAFGRQLKLSELKSNFVSSVSHELRSPLASVRLMAESLERGRISERPKQKEYFRFIVQECRRLSSLIENVLDFSRIEQGRKEYEFEPTDLASLAKQTVKLMEPYAAERQLALALAVPDSQLSTLKSQLLLDGKAIQQALVNLIDNAIKHSPKGETVTVGLEVSSDECRVSSEEPAPTRDSRPGLDPRNSTLVTLFVEDHGEGIPPAEHQKIFERFYRRGSELRRETQGVGIGLSIVKHIVEAHGGRVLVRSAVGEGTRFTIELPAMTNPKSEQVESMNS